MKEWQREMMAYEDSDVIDFTPREPSDKPSTVRWIIVSFLLGAAISAYVVYQIMKG